MSIACFAVPPRLLPAFGAPGFSMREPAGMGPSHTSRIRNNRPRAALAASRSPCSHRRTGRHRSALSPRTDGRMRGKSGWIPVASCVLRCPGILSRASAGRARLIRPTSLPKMECMARPLDCRSRRLVGGLKSLAAGRARSSLSQHLEIGLAQLGRLSSLKPWVCRPCPSAPEVFLKSNGAQ